MQEILIGGFVTIMLAFVGWMTKEVLALRTKLVELESRITAQEKTCCERLDWMRGMNEKLDAVAEGINKISGYLEAKKE